MSDRQPLIILTCMRSYSSLVSTMLGQHSGLYTLPEINPFLAETIGELEDLVRAVRPRTMDGCLRSVAQLEFGEQTDATIAEAREWLSARRDWPFSRFIDHLADKVAPGKLVEKSPSTTIRHGGLERAIRTFPDAFFLHLYRHPVSVTRSIVNLARQNEAAGLRAKGTRSPDPEVSWFEANAGIMRAAGRISPGRFMSIRGEDILRDCDRYLTQICDWLGLETAAADLEAMRHPERSPFAFIGPASARFGNDPNFLRNPGFSPRPIHEPPLDDALDWASPTRRLKPATVALSHQLGYDGYAG